VCKHDKKKEKEGPYVFDMGDACEHYTHAKLFKLYNLPKNRNKAFVVN